MAIAVKALITPEVLKWAREKRIRLDIEFAAERLEIDPDRLEKWENGKEQPTFAQLKKIANDEANMILIPAGEFEMGHKGPIGPTQYDPQENEVPSQPIPHQLR